MGKRTTKSFENLQNLTDRITQLETDVANLKSKSYINRQKPIDCHEASKILGISLSTLRKLTSKGSVPHGKFGNRYYYLESKLKLYLASKSLNSKRRMKRINPTSNDSQKRPMRRISDSGKM
ncbi:MAG TPA: DNA-binding protein [Pricia antarctica]|uniref:DNA-binding protein n=1 Tax=Pricia antarctica TaxID=641691 RepID=A0A831VRB1_9FLAO|nr:DNA-binding protein [Pricia antarctica]